MAELDYWTPVRVNLPEKASFSKRTLYKVAYAIDSCFYIGSYVSIFTPEQHNGSEKELIEKRQERLSILGIIGRITVFSAIIFITYKKFSYGIPLGLAPLAFKACYKYGHVDRIYFELRMKSQLKEQFQSNPYSEPDMSPLDLDTDEK
jgi:hypothetical protein